jgi:hypothetical protein
MRKPDFIDEKSAHQITLGGGIIHPAPMSFVGVLPRGHCKLYKEKSTGTLRAHL